MQEQPTTPDELWLLSWLAANAPWIIAGFLSAFVRFVYRWGVDRVAFRPAASEALLCGSVVSTLSPMAAWMGLNADWALLLGVLIGFAGPDVIQGAVIDRIRAVTKALIKGDEGRK